MPRLGNALANRLKGIVTSINGLVGAVNFTSTGGTIAITNVGQNVNFETTGGGGAGTVTSVNITPANGVTASGGPITTSGAITVGLGNITPTSVAASGTVTGSNLSGTNTGDQTITLTGEATGSGTGSFAVTLTNSAVIGKVLTGYVSGAGTISATDTILQAFQKLNGNTSTLYVPYTGATADVNLGTFRLSLGAAPSGKLDITTTGLGVTQTDTSGITLLSGTAAAAGAQQISPGARWRGFGWGTTAGTSQPVDFRAFVLPAQGLTPTGVWKIQAAINGGAYTDVFSISETSQMAINGNLSLNSVLAASILRVGASSQMQWNARSNMFSPVDGNILLQNNASTDFGRLQLGGTTSSFPSIKRNTTNVDIRLADDSAYTNIFSLNSDDATIKSYTALGSVIVADNPIFPMALVGAGANLTNGRINFTAVYLAKPTTITGVKWIVKQVGSYTGNNYNGFGLYSYSGGTLTLQASTTNDATIFTAALGINNRAFASTYAASAGIYFIAQLYNNSAEVTPPQIANSSLTAAVNGTLDFTNSGTYAARGTGTALPSSQAMSGLTAQQTIFGLALY